MVLDKKINLSDFFYSSSEWVRKLQRQLAASTAHFAQELLMNVQCSGGSRSFAKETRALKMRSIVASHQKSTTIERIVKADLLKTTGKVAKELNINL